jgi:filamentous hemagglutinin family protein
MAKFLKIIGQNSYKKQSVEHGDRASFFARLILSPLQVRNVGAKHSLSWFVSFNVFKHKEKLRVFLTACTKTCKSIKKRSGDNVRKFLHSLISFCLVIQPVLVSAQESKIIAHDQTQVTKVLGVPVIAINAPNSAGDSITKFDAFMVGKEGVVINNSTVAGQSQLAGNLPANERLGGNSALRIINEVTGTHESLLQGITEVFGNRAEYFLVNGNGIVCKSCGFINTRGVTLATGKSNFSNNGSLASITVNDGLIDIGELGLLAADADNVELLARAIRLQGAIKTQGNLRVVAGKFTAHSDGKITPIIADSNSANSNNEQNFFAVDSSHLGGMYAKKISIIANEQGVGVNMNGAVVALGGDVEISADGSLNVREIKSAKNISLNSSSGKVKIADSKSADQTSKNGSLQALGAVSITAADELNINSVSLKSGNDFSLQAKNIAINNTDVNANNINASADYMLFYNSSLQAQNIVLQAKKLLSSFASLIITEKDASIKSDAFLLQEKSTLVSGNNLLLESGFLQQFSESLIRVFANAKLMLKHWQQDANSNFIVENKLQGTISGDVSQSGKIKAENIDLRAKGVWLHQGEILASGDIYLNSDLLFSNKGVLSSDSNIWLSTLSDGFFINEEDGNISAKNIHLSAGSIETRGDNISLINEWINPDKLLVGKSAQKGIVSKGILSILAAKEWINNGLVSAGEAVNFRGLIFTQNSVLSTPKFFIDQAELFQNTGIIDASLFTAHNVALINNAGVLQSDYLNLLYSNISNFGRINIRGDSDIKNASLWLNIGEWLQQKNLKISAENIINHGNLLVSESLHANAANLGELSGIVFIGGEAIFNAKQLDLSGDIISGDKLQVQANIFSLAGNLSAKAINISSDFIANLQGSKLLSTESITLEASNMALNGEIEALGNITLAALEKIQSSGAIKAAKNLSFAAATQIISGKIEAGLNIVVAAQEKIISAAEIISGNSIKFLSDLDIYLAGDVRGVDVEISAKKDIINSADMQAKNLLLLADENIISAGTINSSENLALVSAKSTIENLGNINSRQDLAIITNNFSNYGEILASRDIDLSSANSLYNSGSIYAQKNTNLFAGGKLTQYGQIRANHDLSIISNDFIDNDSSGIKSGNNLSIITSVGLVKLKNLISGANIFLSTKKIDANNLFGSISGSLALFSDEEISATGSLDIGKNLLIYDRTNYSNLSFINQANLKIGENIHAATSRSFKNYGNIRVGNLADIKSDFITLAAGGNFSAKQAAISAASILIGAPGQGENSGIVNISNNADLYLLGKSSFWNYGKINISNDLTISRAQKNGDEFFHNYGVLYSGGNINLETAWFSNSGTISAGSDIFLRANQRADLSNSGKLSAGRDLIFSTDGLETIALKHFQAKQNLVVDAKSISFSELSDQLSNNLILSSSGVITQENTINLGGNFTLLARPSENLVLDNRGNLNIAGAFVFDGQSLYNQGIMRVGDSAINVGGNSFYNKGVFETPGNLTIFSTGPAENTGRINVGGTLELIAGYIKNQRLWFNNNPVADSGIINANGNINLISSSTIENLAAASIQANGALNLQSYSDINSTAFRQELGGGVYGRSFTFQSPYLSAQGSVGLRSQFGNINLQATNVSSGYNVTIDSGQNISLAAAEGSYTDAQWGVIGYHRRRFGGGFNIEGWINYEVPVVVPTHINAPSGFTAIAHNGNITLLGSSISSAGQALLSAAGSIRNKVSAIGDSSGNSRTPVHFTPSIISAEGDVILSAAGNIQNQASLILSGADIDLNAVGDISNEAQISSYISNYIWSKKLKLIERDFITQAAEISAAGNVGLSSGLDIKNIGSNISAGRNLNLAAGNDALFSSLSQTADNYYSAKSSKWFSAVSAQGGWSSSATLLPEIAAGGDVTIIAADDLLGKGAQISAGGNLNLAAGGDIKFSAEQVQQYKWSKSKAFGLTLPGITGAALSVLQGADFSGDGLINKIPVLGTLANYQAPQGVLDLGQTMKLGTEIYQASILWKNLGKTDFMTTGMSFAGLTTIGGVIAPVGIGFFNNSSSSQSNWVNSFASNVSSGRDINIASGEDISLVGSKIISDRNLQISAVRDLVVTALKEESSSVINQKGQSASISAIAGGLQGSIGMHQANGEAKQINWLESKISALGNLRINAGRDLLAIGAQIEGESTAINVANNLLLESVQKEYQSSLNSGALTFSAFYGGGVFIPGGFISKEDAAEKEKTIQKLTALIGRNSIEVNVGNTTTIKAAEIANITLAGIDGKQLKLNTRELEYSDIANSLNSRRQAISAGFDPSAYAAKPKDESTTTSADATKTINTNAEISVKGMEPSNITTNVVGGYQSQDQTSITRATIGAGEIIIDGKVAKPEDLPGLNRDVNKVTVATQDDKFAASFFVVDKMLTAPGRQEMLKGIYSLTPTEVSKTIDSLNEHYPAPNLMPNLWRSKSHTGTETKKDSSFGAFEEFPARLISPYENNPALQLINHLVPGVNSATQFHDVAMLRQKNEPSGIEKAGTIVPYFMMNYYGSLGTSINQGALMLNEALLYNKNLNN